MISAVLLFALATSDLQALMLPRTFTTPAGVIVPYRLYVPPGQSKLPLVLFLHGGAGRGTDNQQQLAAGNGMLAGMFVETKGAIVVAPQTASEHDAVAIGALLDEVMRRFDVDASRVYVVGQSLGGFGVLDLLARYPRRFAGAVIIASGRTLDLKRQLGTVPIWIFHGERDRVIPVEIARALVTAQRRAGGEVRYTEYRGEEHGLAWLVVREKGLVPWLFAQHRSR